MRCWPAFPLEGKRSPRARRRGAGRPKVLVADAAKVCAPLMQEDSSTANVTQVLDEEIARVANKEIRGEDT